VCDYILEAGSWALALEAVAPEARGPLHGLPVSVKECFYVQGYDSTIGLAQHIGRPATSDCSFVAGLKELGALPFCLTNVPQTMVSASSFSSSSASSSSSQVSYACSNPVYGVTENPHQAGRSPGALF